MEVPMDAPNYTKYSIYQLEDVLRNVDGEKYPGRLELIESEMAKRKAMGELLVEKSGSYLWEQKVPFINGS